MRPRISMITLVKTLAVFTLLFTLGSGCDDDDPQCPGPVKELSFRFLSGTISANLMPIIPPDPIGASLEVEVSNLTPYTITQVSIPWADVVHADSIQTLGRIDFSTTWGGVLAPMKTDTVTLTKINAGTKLFDPPCTERVVLKCQGRRDNQNIVVFDSDTLTFACFQ